MDVCLAVAIRPSFLGLKMLSHALAHTVQDDKRRTLVGYRSAGNAAKIALLTSRKVTGIKNLPIGNRIAGRSHRAL
jgi:hypothetical protein